MSSKKEAVILLSGGLDSAVTSFIAKEDVLQGRGTSRLHCLSFDYGQRNERTEGSCAILVAAELGKYLEVSHSFIDLKSAFEFCRSTRILGKGRDKQGVPWVFQRNSIFLAVAFGYAEAIGAGSVYIGVTQSGLIDYPDCRIDFLRGIESALNLGNKVHRDDEGDPIELRVPLVDYTKAAVVSLGSRLGVPFSITWSCYKGEERPCGECIACRKRIEAFKEANMEDVIEYRV